MLNEPMHDVALRDDAVDGFAVLADDERADVAGNQLLHGSADRLARTDRRDPTPLGAQNGLDVHRKPRMTWRGRRSSRRSPPSLGQNAASGNKSPRASAAEITIIPTGIPMAISRA